MLVTIKKWMAERTRETCLQRFRRIQHSSRQAPLVIHRYKRALQRHMYDFYARQILLHELHPLRPTKVSKPVTVRQWYLCTTRRHVAEFCSALGRYNAAVCRRTRQFSERDGPACASPRADKPKFQPFVMLGLVEQNTRVLLAGVSWSTLNKD